LVMSVTGLEAFVREDGSMQFLTYDYRGVLKARSPLLSSATVSSCLRRCGISSPFLGP
jgi:hypothetical protein